MLQLGGGWEKGTRDLSVLFLTTTYESTYESMKCLEKKRKQSLNIKG